MRRSRNSHSADVGDEGAAISAAELLGFVATRVREQAQAHPLRTLGFAAGAGYVLGRGIPSFVVRLGVIAAARMATDSVLAAAFGSIAAPSTEGGDDDVGTSDDDEADVAGSGDPPTSPPRRARGGRMPREEAGRRANDD